MVALLLVCTLVSVIDRGGASDSVQRDYQPPAFDCQIIEIGVQRRTAQPQSGASSNICENETWI